ncbi:MAG: cadherin-like domain-containing protein [Candidatus Pacearchaeota archaeon]|jgi:uncharacterized integral membrane protein|nr:cadherin-like domain-containing protein [Candidatus Pacearchaeota archaeon]|tara:strand:- start:40 stop:1287 length:1248 start_codon:yes stop_codon:yes gene_type:complete
MKKVSGQKFFILIILSFIFIIINSYEIDACASCQGGYWNIPPGTYSHGQKVCGGEWDRLCVNGQWWVNFATLCSQGRDYTCEPALKSCYEEWRWAACGWATCGDGYCDGAKGETCGSCGTDCGPCPCSPSWSSWSGCSASCGGGTQTRTDGCGSTQSQSCTQSCNSAPVSTATTFTTTKDTAINTTMSATDVNGDSLTYTIVSNPSNGVLSGTSTTRTYTPNSNFSGIDSYTYLVNDGSANSNIATITIIVNDISAPLIIIVSPLTNQEYDSSDISFEITTDELATTWFSVDGEDNVTMSTTNSLTFSDTITLSHGEHSVIFYANDSHGNEGANSVSFTVDTRKDTSGDKKSWRDNYLFESLSTTNDFLFSDLETSEEVKDDIRKSSQTINWVFTLVAILLVVALIVLFMKSGVD